MSMLVQRIALLAERLGVPLPRVAGQTRLGLAGTLRVRSAIPVTCSHKAAEQISNLPQYTDLESVLADFNRYDVWAWIQTKDANERFRAPEVGKALPDALAQCSEGKLAAEEFRVMLATARLTLVCQIARDGGSLRAFMVWETKYPPHPTASLLVANFIAESNSGFDLPGFCTMVAAQARLRVGINPREIEREAGADRDFITGVRRYLEALRNHANAAAPRMRYEVVDRSPVRLRPADEGAWPRAFTRAGTQLAVPTVSGRERRLFVLDVSDDDVLTMDGDDPRNELVERDELKVQPGTDSLKRMREALDMIAMSADDAHGRLLDALTRPEGLKPLPPREIPATDEQSARQQAAKALALNTPDIALIHGPPGTGKTTVICGIVEELVKSGKRVLLVAPTHVALDNVLERLGNRQGVTAIRLGSPDSVEAQAHRFLLQNRSKDLTGRLAAELRAATQAAPADDGVAAVQREWANRIGNDEEAGALLLLNANLVCATPIGIAMAREFRNVEVLFDVMILDEASKATLTDFLVPAARARRWILVGDHRQLPPYVDNGELEAVISERMKRAEVAEPDPAWLGDLSTRLRQHFDNRMHPDPLRRDKAWRDFVGTLAAPFMLDRTAVDELVALGADSDRWRSAQRSTERGDAQETSGTKDAKPQALRLGAELIELQSLALPSVFERLTRLPESRSVRLNFQHRMKPELAAFSAEMVYNRDYPSAPATAQLGLEIPSLEAPSIWIDTAYAPPAQRYEYPRDTNWTGGAYVNKLETAIAVELVEACAAWAVQSWRGDPRPGGRGAGATFEIGVTAFYLKQALALRDAIFEKLGAGNDPWRREWTSRAANGAPIDIHVSIVDRFQGREKDVVVLSATRSNPKGRRGHVDNLNRLNVALTRARHKRIVIGDSATLTGHGKHRRDSGDLLVHLYETSERKPKWGRAMGGQA
ncbi:Superfamily I DNA and RNA helicases and helicase subunits-like protein [Paraburkholderia unamae]|uniref:AAA domain-containing protein n=1 Tax=Paraburkholderia unamae TaxID=219649 RepID=UPI001CB5F87B|nr:AAA domain-containing protein [Paraburkholderia unamae]CAG9261398.1 Superfamily I DNA and RNA helicases and helicase subunits-like protein [Paraburkholderia unamae]